MAAPLAVVVVTHDSRDAALACLDALARDADHRSWQVVVIDNASMDGTAEALRSAHPWAQVVRNETGRGFAGAVNQGFSLTDAPAVAVLTASTVVPAGALPRLRAVLLSEERVAAVAPLIRFPDGRVQRHGLFRPRPYTALVVLLGLARFRPFAREAERYYGPHEPGPPLGVEQVSGACIVIRRDAFEDVGAFDAERFFLYCEDVDWCLRARERGWKILFVPEVAATRRKAATSASASRRSIRTYYRSLRAFYAKHEAARTPLLVRPLWYAGAYLKEASALLADALRPKKGLRY
jgi:N-acetylglucosaminyl-diphospho-decaprenol L-rhamnosyltransferase